MYTSRPILSIIIIEEKYGQFRIDTINNKEPVSTVAIERKSLGATKYTVP